MSSQQIDRYIIQDKLGQGGMASVYRAHDPRFERDIAIKVLPREFLHDPTFRERFDREARMIAQMEHSAIVPVHDFGEYDGQPYLVMRYLPGGSLSERIKEQGALPLDEVTTILQRIASALDFAHERGLIHRDVKPGNIIFDADGEAYLSDFGLVRLTEDTDQLTQSGMVGTPAYLAPEVADLSGTTPLIDIYALGVTLFQMLTGELPYLADTPMGLIVAHINKPVPLLSDYRPDLPDTLQSVIDRALDKDPAQRYQTAGALAAEFALAIRGELRREDTHVLSPRQAAKARAAGAGGRADRSAPGGQGRSVIGWIVGGVAVIALIAAGVLLAGPKLGLTLGAAASPTATVTEPPPTTAPTVTPLPPSATPEPATETPVPPTPTVEPTATPGWVSIYESSGFQLSQTAAGWTTEEIPQTVDGAFRLSFMASFVSPSGNDFANGFSLDVRSDTDAASEVYNAWRTFFLSRQGTYRVGQLINTTIYSAIEDHTSADSFNPDLVAANEVVLTGQAETLTLTINGEEVTQLSHPVDGLIHELFWRVYEGTTIDIRSVVLEKFE